MLDNPDEEQQFKGSSQFKIESPQKQEKSQLDVIRAQKRMSSRIFPVNTNMKTQRFASSIMTTKKRIANILDSPQVTIVMAFITIYALFGDDIRQLVTDKNGDQGFWVVTLFCMTMFLIELTISSFAKVTNIFYTFFSFYQDGYFLSFFFWLDFISTVSMIFDVGWINQAIFGTSGGSAVSTVSLTRAGRASRIGTRAGRIVRIVRLVRLAKIYKNAKQTLEREAQKLLESQMREQDRIEQENNQISNQQISQQHIQQEAKSGKSGHSQVLSNKSGDDQNQEQQEPFSPHSINLRSPKKQRLSQIDHLQVPNGGQDITHTNQDAAHSPLNRGVRPRKISHGTQKSQVSSSLSQSRSGNQQSIFSGVRQQSKIFQPANASESQNETNIGKELNELTIKRVITIVMCILISVPILNLNTYNTNPSSFDLGIQSILEWKGQPLVYQAMLDDYIDYHLSQRESLIELAVDDIQIYPYNNATSNEGTVRIASLNYYTTTYTDFETQKYETGSVITSTSQDDDLNALLSIIRTIFVSIVLSIAAVLFSQDVQDLVLTPVEQMLQTVEGIAKNPLKAAQEEENKAFIQMTQAKDVDVKAKEEDDKLETIILQKLIIKIGALLAIGFGEAGSEIIAQNMGNSANVNPMLPGKKMMAIFGFCDIRNFTDATEVLQQEVMVFVNEIADIVHSCVDQFCGNANKNIGDAFLLVWKFQDNDFTVDTDGNLALKPYDYIAQTADMAILAFVTIITKITSSPKLAKYKLHEGLLARIPNYSVKMGFGLHCGWAIEGAIGSEYKIDASYLSPNVNMASRLEAATKQFGSWILISGQLRDIATRATQAQMRLIDRVTVKGSLLPIDIYTVDMNLDVLNRLKRKESKIVTIEPENKKKVKVLMRMKRDKLKLGITKNTIRIADQWEKDALIKAVRAPFEKKFYELWEVGFQHYINGKWEDAKKIFEQTLTYQKNYRDGPSNTLLTVIKEDSHNLGSWKGYRELTEK